MIERIWLKNFRRYVDEQITLKPGINFIDGPNNAGKSTVLYAIEYALFGRVGQVKTLAALMHPKAKEMGVELRFVGVDGERYVLQRMHEKPPRSKSTVHGSFTLKRLANEEKGTGDTYIRSSDFEDREEHLALALQEILGLSRRLFDVAVHVKQGEITAMLEGAPELDTVLGVTASVLAGEELRAMALEFEKEASALPVLQESVQHLRADVADAAGREQQAEMAAKHATAEVSRLQAVLTEAQAESDEDEANAVAAHEAALDEVQGTTASIDSARARLPTAWADRAAEQAAAAVQTLDTEVKAHREQTRTRDVELHQATQRLTDLAARLAKGTNAADDAVCDACGQAIDAAHAAHQRDAWMAEQTTLTARREALQNDAEAAEVAGQDLEQRLQEARRAVEVFGELQTLQTRLATSASTLATCEAAALAMGLQGAGPALFAAREAKLNEARSARQAVVVRTETLLETATTTATTASAALNDVRARSQGAEKELARVQAEVERLEGRRQVAGRLRTLSQGFKELQTQLRDRAAVELGAEVLALHQALSAPEQEYKGLSIDPNRYVVHVTPHDINAEVPAYAFQGGGHKLLLGLAFKLAVARRVGQCPFVLLDEPTYGLDAERRASLLSRIAGLDQSKQMILITHHDVDDVSGHHIRIEKSAKQSTVRIAGEDAAGTAKAGKKRSGKKKDADHNEEAA